MGEVMMGSHLRCYDYGSGYNNGSLPERFAWWGVHLHAWFLSGADVTRGTWPILAPAFAVGKTRLVVVAVEGAPPMIDRNRVCVIPRYVGSQINSHTTGA
jgi:hypothetical protein